MIAVDPGSTTGLAVFNSDGELVRAERILEPVHSSWHWDGPTGEVVWCEMPQKYVGGKASPQNLITLAFTAGYVVGELKPIYVETVFPRAWKGQRPKSVDNRLTLALLSDQERQILKDQGCDHNVLDAVGIGLWSLKRR